VKRRIGEVPRSRTMGREYGVEILVGQREAGQVSNRVSHLGKIGNCCEGLFYPRTLSWDSVSYLPVFDRQIVPCLLFFLGRRAMVRR
jgi:hypothetical protein